MISGFQQALLLAFVLLFAFNLGAHYTGATVGMPYASRCIALWPALAIVAIFALLGATFASGSVEHTVGLRLIAEGHARASIAIVIVACAGVLTMGFNRLRLPTSTIQILVFCVIGAALAANLRVRWSTVIELAIVWVSAPLASAALGFLLTRAADAIVPEHAAAQQARLLVQRAAERHPDDHLAASLPGLAHPLPADLLREAAAERPAHPGLAVAALKALPAVMVLVGIAASFVMGSNDVANATGVLLLVHFTSSPTAAGAIGGAGMFVGALAWGSRILRRVAFDVVELDLAMASAAQGVQALVVILAVSEGLFTSMNQALIAAMAGAGIARGRETVNRRQLTAILRGWVVGPGAGLLLAYLMEMALR